MVIFFPFLATALPKREPNLLDLAEQKDPLINPAPFLATWLPKREPVRLDLAERHASAMSMVLEQKVPK